MKKLLLIATLALVFVPVALAGLPPASSGSVSVAAGSDLSYQGQVTFDYTYPNHLNNPRIYVECDQNGSLVYGEAGRASDTFTLGGGWSLWVEAGGGPADCTATLYYFKTGNHEWNGSGQQVYVELAQTTFHAGG